jgi:hypothetical protein
MPLRPATDIQGPGGLGLQRAPDEQLDSYGHVRGLMTMDEVMQIQARKTGNFYLAATEYSALRFAVRTTQHRARRWRGLSIGRLSGLVGGGLAKGRLPPPDSPFASCSLS